MNKRIATEVALGIIIIAAVIAGGSFWYVNRQIKTVPDNRQGICTWEAKVCPDGSSVGRSGPNCEFAPCPSFTGIENKIIINSPKSGEIITSPVKIAGRAVGTWFFEGSFPVEIFDGKNKIIGQGAASFNPKSDTDTWMTEDFVDFAGSIPFSAPETPNGFIVFKKDNPSDLPALEEAFRMPIKFNVNTQANKIDWRSYQNEKLGFSLGFPESWQGYDTSESSNDNSVCFSFKDGHQPFCIFYIRKLSLAQWNQSGAKSGMVKITEDQGSVYACDGCCGQGDTTGGGQFDAFQQKRCAEGGKILETFQLIINE